MKKIVLIPLIALVLFSACGNSEQEWPPKPVNIHLGEDACTACRMIISQESYGAQLHHRGKQVELFDDYGCLLKRRPAGDSETRVIFVRSTEDGSWLREEEASYVFSKQISSPMGYGIAAFATKESAAQFAKRFNGSEIFSASELISGAEKILHAR